MRYMMLVNDRAEPDVLQSFLEREVGPEAKEAVVTPAQRLIEQGVQQGEIESWALRVLSAATLDDVLAN